MTKYISFLLVAFLMISTTQVFAYDPPTKKNKVTSSESFGYEIAFETYRSAVYQSDDRQKVFVDFGEIPVNLKSIRVLNSTGDVLLTKIVYDLPVNSLYEIDLSQFSNDDLVLEIETFTDSRFITLGADN
ncbi:MAG TPA: hypothetical protein ENK85_09555 [Saprospiraceae bacterium]|nr:hypothetical protein [Saprospiraceae bacterium]